MLIIDWDVHHGNGTQALMERDATIRFVSLHQHPWYPGTGMAEERGVGNVFNVPRGPGAPASLYVEDLWAAIVAATDGWIPHIVLLSAGYDAMYGDPLGGFTLEPSDYAGITIRLRERLPACAYRGAARGRIHPGTGGGGGRSDRRRARMTGSLQQRYTPTLRPHSGVLMSHALRMEAEVLNLRTRHPFIIARGGQSDYRTVWVRLVDQDGVEGWGEAAPARIYGETTETVLAALQAYAEHLPDDPFQLEAIERQWEKLLAPESVRAVRPLRGPA